MLTNTRAPGKKIVFDGNAFWLWITSGENIEKIDLASGNLPCAFKTARKLGHEVRHWCHLDMRVLDIPNSINCG